MDKQAQLEQLENQYAQCGACPLANLGRSRVVFGEGNPDATIMLVGEAPGQKEDELGRPFIGRSGKLLTRIIEQAGMSRSDLYITNVVKCRPPNNRKPQPGEIKTCRNLLLVKQVGIIKPKLVVTLGAAALEGILGHRVKISQERGKLIEIKHFSIMPTCTIVSLTLFFSSKRMYLG